MRNNIAIFATIIILSSCAGETSNKHNVQTRENDSLTLLTLNFEKIPDIENADSLHNFFINNIAKGISFIPIESSAKAWPGNMIHSMIISEENYIISGMMPGYRINLYNQNGELFKNISSAGNGERELPDWPQGVFANLHLGRLCARSSRKVLINSVRGKYLDNIHLGKEVPFVGDMVLLNSGDYACTPAIYLEMDDNNIPYLFFMNDEGELISPLYYGEKRSLKQFAISEANQDRMRNRERNNLVSNYLGDALFRDQFCDTVYSLKSREMILPYLNLHRGSLMPTPTDSYDPDKNKKKIYHNAILETEKYVIVKYMYDLGIYTSIWDKKGQNIIANLRIERDLKQEGLGYKFHAYYKTPSMEKILVNLVCATKDRLYCLVDAEKACSFLPDINEYDNPVIMIVDLK